jgi:excisionase family DNA binding protein
MSNKIQPHHTQRPAYIYIRQSTMGQVRHHQESTARQYALRDKALDGGWAPDQIRILDGDLGLSGAHASQREDFKTLVADVTMGQVGAVVALEASRLARSSADWHRLIEVCSLTGTLILDEDGSYDPADFNDGLLLGLKGTMSQAELHFIRARLQGGKTNKAQKGELRFPLPVGLCHDEEGQTILDPDQQVQGAVRLIFQAFRQTGSAYGVLAHFRDNSLEFPKRAYGGIWAGRLVWGPLSHARVLGVVKNPSYAGAYVYGRYRATRQISPDGEIRSAIRKAPLGSWSVLIQDHHEGYISWEEYLQNQVALERNQTNGEATRLSGPVREGLALLQGLLLCGHCGRRVTVRYQGNGGLYPIYECSWLRREGVATSSCLTIRCDSLDKAFTRRVMEVMQPAQLEIALKAVEELEHRDQAVVQQWQMRLQQADYEAQLAERRYEQVDPANRLVAANLERRWNVALQRAAELKEQFEQHRQAHSRAFTLDQKARVLGLAQDFPKLWNAQSTSPKDRKRMLRLLVEDITLEKQGREAVLHIRWRGGATEDLRVERPRPAADQVRYSPAFVQKVRELAREFSDDQIAARLNEEGIRPSKGPSFTVSGVRWIRHRHRIPGPPSRQQAEVSVQELADRLGVSRGLVYHWIHNGQVEARRRNQGSPFWIKLDDAVEARLRACLAAQSES